MLNLEYEIRYNEEGRPYIHLPKDFDGNKAEHLFMIYEMARYALFDLLDKNEKIDDLKDESIIKIAEAGHTITQISDEYANILKGINKHVDNIDDIIEGKTPDNE